MSFFKAARHFDGQWWVLVDDARDACERARRNGYQDTIARDGAGAHRYTWRELMDLSNSWYKRGLANGREEASRTAYDLGYLHGRITAG